MRSAVNSKASCSCRSRIFNAARISLGETWMFFREAFHPSYFLVNLKSSGSPFSLMPATILRTDLSTFSNSLLPRRETLCRKRKKSFVPEIMIFMRLFLPPFYLCPELIQFFVKLFIPPVQVVDPGHFGRSFSGYTRQD